MALAYRAHFAFAARTRSRRRRAPDERGVRLPARASAHPRAARSRSGSPSCSTRRSPPSATRRTPSTRRRGRRCRTSWSPQLEWIRTMVEARGIPFLRVPGLRGRRRDRHARDARVGEAATTSWIVSGDKDMTQLVAPRVTLYNVQRRERGARSDLVDEASVAQRYGVPPSRVIDVLALMGDASDNVPGVPGIGEKTASRADRRARHVEAVLAAAPTLPQKRLARALVAHAESARLSKRLVTIESTCRSPREFDDARDGAATDVDALRAAATARSSSTTSLALGSRRRARGRARRGRAHVLYKRVDSRGDVDDARCDGCRATQRDRRLRLRHRDDRRRPDTRGARGALVLVEADGGGVVRAGQPPTAALRRRGRRGARDGASSSSRGADRATRATC